MKSNSIPNPAINQQEVKFDTIISRRTVPCDPEIKHTPSVTDSNVDLEFPKTMSSESKSSGKYSVLFTAHAKISLTNGSERTCSFSFDTEHKCIDPPKDIRSLKTWVSQSWEYNCKYPSISPDLSYLAFILVREQRHIQSVQKDKQIECTEITAEYHELIVYHIEAQKIQRLPLVSKKYKSEYIEDGLSNESKRADATDDFYNRELDSIVHFENNPRKFMLYAYGGDKDKVIVNLTSEGLSMLTLPKLSFNVFCELIESPCKTYFVILERSCNYVYFFKQDPQSISFFEDWTLKGHDPKLLALLPGAYVYILRNLDQSELRKVNLMQDFEETLSIDQKRYWSCEYTPKGMLVLTHLDRKECTQLLLKSMLTASFSRNPGFTIFSHRRFLGQYPSFKHFSPTMRMEIENLFHRGNEDDRDALVKLLQGTSPAECLGGYPRSEADSDTQQFLRKISPKVLMAPQ